MNYDDFVDGILKVLPRADFGEDKDGQIVIYTDLKVVWSQYSTPGGPFLTADVVPLTDKEK